MILGEARWGCNLFASGDERTRGACGRKVALEYSSKAFGFPSPLEEHGMERSLRTLATPVGKFECLATMKQ